MYVFGDLLRQFRVRAGLTQQQLANELGVSRTALNAWETLRARPRLSRELIIRLGVILILDEDDLNQLLLALDYTLESVEQPTLPKVVRQKAIETEYLKVTRQLELAPGVLLPQPERRADCYQHISLPVNYIERPEILAVVRTQLLAQSAPVVLTSAVKGRPTALHGMGGIGKTVIARVLCDDSAVQEAFPDGILWASLGQTPNLLDQLRLWIEALGGRISETVPTLESLKRSLAKLLKNRTCLLILDDVWQHTHVQVFRVDAPSCRLLLTTRDVEVARALGGQVQPIPVMKPDDAIKLLDVWADGHLIKAELALKRKIVKRLGYLPLAVKLAGAQLQRTLPNEWLQAFDARKLSSSRTEELHDSLEQTFMLSINALDGEARRLYLALAIFKEDEETPQVAIEQLWQGVAALDANATRDLLDDLAARALLELTAQDAWHTIRLHDLLRDLIRGTLGVEALLTMHQVLLAAYQTSCIGNSWYSGPNDGYYFEHLAYHLLQGGHDYELYSLLTVSPQWMEAKFVACNGDTAFLGDLDLLIDRFTDPLTPDQLVQLAALYSARQVISHRTRSFTDRDLKILVFLGRETEALAYARLREQLTERVDGLLAIQSALQQSSRSQPQLFDELMNLVAHIRDIAPRVQRWRKIAIALHEASDVRASWGFTQALGDIRIIPTHFAIASRLSEYVELVIAMRQCSNSEAEQVLGEAIQWVGSTKEEDIDFYQEHDWNRAIDQLTQIAIQFGRISEGIEIANHIKRDSWWKDQALDTAVNVLCQAGKYDDAVQLIKLIEHPAERATALCTLAEQLAQSGDKATSYEIFRSTLEFTQKIPPAGVSRLSVIKRLAEALSKTPFADLMSTALTYAADAARAVEWGGLQQLYALGGVAVLMAKVGDTRAEAIFTELINLAQAIPAGRKDHPSVSDAKEEDSPEATFFAEVVSLFSPSDAREGAFRSLAGYLAQARKISDALHYAHLIKNNVERLRALCEIASSQIGVNAALVSKIIEELAEVASTIKIGRTDWERVWDLVDLSKDLLNAEYYEDALKLAQQIPDPRQRTMVLSLLAEKLAASNASQAQAVFDEAVGSARATQNSAEFAVALRAMAEAFIGSGDHRASMLLDRAVAAAHLAQIDFTDEDEHTFTGWTKAQDELVKLVIDLGRIERYSHAEKVAFSIQDDERRVLGLAGLAKFCLEIGKKELSVKIFDRTERAARSIENQYIRAGALGKLGEVLVKCGFYGHAKKIAKRITETSEASGILASLAAVLTQEDKLAEAWEVADSIKRAERRFTAFCDLAVAYVKAGKAEKVSAAFDQARNCVNATRSDKTQYEFLLDLAEAYTKAGNNEQASAILNEASKLIHKIENVERRTSALCRLAVALTNARQIEQTTVVFNEARDVSEALNIEAESYSIPSALADLPTFLARCNRFDDAITAALRIRMDGLRTEALAGIFSECLRADRIEQAQKAVELMTQGETRVKSLLKLAIVMERSGNKDAALPYFGDVRQYAETLEYDFMGKLNRWSLARSLAEAGHFSDALNVLSICEIDDFLHSVAEWSPSLELLERGLPVSILLNIVRILGWVRPDWDNIHSRLITLPF